MGAHSSLLVRAAVVVGAVIALAACAAASSDDASVTGSPPGASASAVVAVAEESPTAAATASAADEELTASPSPSAAPSETATENPGGGEASFLDIEGEWCPSVADSPEECFTVDLPMVGGPDGAYVYLRELMEEDPRALTDADYDLPPDMGECWAGNASSYPPEGGTTLWYCPANAVAGMEPIDDPEPFFASYGYDGDIPDHRDRDRLYVAQDFTPYPFLRADG
ncbi:hypothetical protein [Demequina mangrovi]|uniref:Uncharacterized protein n=1 Tax=Demequina mangrovi TaxID=1043493 RepID=A0A1H6YZL4_9MICO|nr:hypothetical protein [Demequina mangrovi]SEJ46651.1 hypothetical protein SAMN05421637_1885 [Demequina mangrovi]